MFPFDDIIMMVQFYLALFCIIVMIDRSLQAPMRAPYMVLMEQVISIGSTRWFVTGNQGSPGGPLILLGSNLHDDVITWKWFPLTGHLWWESTSHWWFPPHKVPAMQSGGVLFVVNLNKLLKKTVELVIFVMTDIRYVYIYIFVYNQTPQKLLGFHQTEDRFWPDFADI